MKLKTTITELPARLRGGVERFLPATVYSVAFFCVFAWGVYHSQDNVITVLMSLALAGVFAVLVRLALELKGAAQDAEKGAAQNSSLDSAQTAPQAAATQGITQGAAEETTQSLSQVSTQNAKQDTLHDAAQNSPQIATQQVPQAPPQINARSATFLTFAVTLPLGALCVWLLKTLESSPYTPMWYFGVVLAAVFAIVWLLYKSAADDERLFAYLAAKAFFCGAVAFALMLGLILCITAFTALLVDVKYLDNLIWLAMAFSFGVVWVNLFLSYIPRRGASPEISKVYRSLVANVALPVYLLLLAILCGYIVKIIFTWTMPEGTMNWYASFALAFYVLLWLGVRFYDGALVRFFKKYVGFAMIPVIIVQIIGIVIRLRAYGLTTARYLSLACLALGVAALVFTLMKKPLRPLFLAAAAVMLIVTVTPLNALDVPAFDQQQRLKSALVANGMYDGERITPSASVAVEDKNTIRSCYRYLRNNAPDPERTDFLKQATAEDFEGVYGFSENAGEMTSSYSIYCESEVFEAPLDISGYDCLVHFYGVSDKNNPYVFKLERNGETVEADLTEYLTELTAELKQDYNRRDDMRYTLPDGTTLVLSYVDVNYENSAPKSANISGYMLYMTRRTAEPADKPE